MHFYANRLRNEEIVLHRGPTTTQQTKHYDKHKFYPKLERHEQQQQQ